MNYQWSITHNINGKTCFMPLNDYQSSFVTAKVWIHLDAVPQISEYLFPVWKSQINSLLPIHSGIYIYVFWSLKDQHFRIVNLIYILSSYTEFSLAELIACILESPSWSCNGAQCILFTVLYRKYRNFILIFNLGSCYILCVAYENMFHTWHKTSGYILSLFNQDI